MEGRAGGSAPRGFCVPLAAPSGPGRSRAQAGGAPRPRLPSPAHPPGPRGEASALLRAGGTHRFRHLPGGLGTAVAPPVPVGIRTGSALLLTGLRAAPLRPARPRPAASVRGWSRGAPAPGRPSRAVPAEQPGRGAAAGAPGAEAGSHRC